MQSSLHLLPCSEHPGPRWRTRPGRPAPPKGGMSHLDKKTSSPNARLRLLPYVASEPTLAGSRPRPAPRLRLGAIVRALPTAPETHEQHIFLSDHLFRPRKQATAMKTPSKYPVPPYKMVNFLRLAPSETINFSRLANVSWTTSSRLAKMRWTTFFPQTDNSLPPPLRPLPRLRERRERGSARLTPHTPRS